MEKLNLAGIVAIIIGVILVFLKFSTMGFPGGCGMLAGETEPTGWACGIPPQLLTTYAIIGLILIVVGIVLLNLKRFKK